MATVELTVHMSDTQRDELESIAKQLGMSVDSVINVFVDEFIAQRGFPFDVVIDEPPSWSKDDFIDEMERRYDDVTAGRFEVHDMIEE